jgi:hypothetical protein
MKTDRASCFIFRIAVVLGHILVFGVRGRSRLRLVRVTQYLIAAVLYYAHPNNLVETLRDHGLNTREQEDGLRLAAANRKRCHDVSYRLTAMANYGVEISPGSLEHEDLHLKID